MIYKIIMSKIFIAHRGNLSGPNPLRENQPGYIQEALDLGFNVEIDAWLIHDTFYLGHDKPEYIVPIDFFLNSNLWVHCKNLAALDELILEPDVNCFSHTNDDYVLSSKCYIMCFPHKRTNLTQNCIAILPERVPGWNLNKAAGIISDYILSFERNYEENGHL
jgi:hypothetical protein